MRYLSKVDFQAHYLPPAYLDFLARHHPGEPDGYPTPDYWTMEWQREKMRLLDVPDTHLLYGSDTPYTPIEACLGQTLALEGSGLITEAQKRKVFTGNALDVNPKLRTIPRSGLSGRHARGGAGNGLGRGGAFRGRRERIRVDTSAMVGDMTIIADIEFDDMSDTHFHGSITMFASAFEPRTGQVSGMWYRMQRSNSLDLDLNLPFAPSRLTIDAFSDAEGRLHGQWSVPHAGPRPIDARIIFDSYASALPQQPGGGTSASAMIRRHLMMVMRRTLRALDRTVDQ